MLTGLAVSTIDARFADRLNAGGAGCVKGVFALKGGGTDQPMPKHEFDAMQHFSQMFPVCALV